MREPDLLSVLLFAAGGTPASLLTPALPWASPQLIGMLAPCSGFPWWAALPGGAEPLDPDTLVFYPGPEKRLGGRIRETR